MGSEPRYSMAQSDRENLFVPQKIVRKNLRFLLEKTSYENKAQPQILMR